MTATAAEMPGSRMVRPADFNPTMKPPIRKTRKLTMARAAICPPLSWMSSTSVASPMSDPSTSPRTIPAAM